MNLSDRTAQARVRAPWSNLNGKTLRLVDGLSDATFERSGSELEGEGRKIAITDHGTGQDLSDIKGFVQIGIAKKKD